MIGKVLQGRYQIVQSLGAGMFGETYVALNIQNPENPKCVVKQLKITNSQPNYLQILRLRFLTETQTLKRLGHHMQIPELLSCFEENERFYLVQEFVEGHSLSAELPSNRDSGYFWSESEVVKFLQDVLRILSFVHSQGVIHCDVKPENLIRRASDGKLVLIDFGSIQPIDFGEESIAPIHWIPVTSLGYIPPEQFIGETQPSSDIYALGMIAIQALTGETPLELKIDSSTRELIWRYDNTPVSDYLAAVLSQMIRYNHKERFPSALEALRAIEQMPLESKEPETEDEQNSLFSDALKNSQPQDGLSADSNRSSSPLLTGMRLGLAANSLVMGFGVYSIIYNTPAYSETETLYKATEEFKAGDLHGAIALAKSIPATSHIYPEAQASIEEWQKEWQIAAQQFQIAENAFKESRWSDVVRAVAKMPNNSYWQAKTTQYVEQAQANIEEQTKVLLSKAYEKASLKDFSAALDYLRQIPSETSAGALIQQKLVEYNHKKHIRASYLLQQAYKKAAEGNFESAVTFLQQVPKDSPVYVTAQAKLIEYTHKQRQQNQAQKVATSKIGTSVNMTQPFINSSSVTPLQSFELGNELREVNIR